MTPFFLTKPVMLNKNDKLVKVTPILLLFDSVLISASFQFVP